MSSRHFDVGDLILDVTRGNDVHALCIVVDIDETRSSVKLYVTLMHKNTSFHWVRKTYLMNRDIRDGIMRRA